MSRTRPDLKPIRAILFDVDGTLYYQRPLRRTMLRELILVQLWGRSLRKTSLTFRVLKHYRRALEELRDQTQEIGEQPSLRDRQFTMVAERCQTSVEKVQDLVRDWMEMRPLRHIIRQRRDGLQQLLEHAKRSDLKVGVFSDYPTAGKVEVLGMTEDVSLQLCGLDAEVGALKPHPRGFVLACQRWGLQPAEVLYVGDRQELDGEGAKAAGMPFRIIGGEGEHAIQTFAELTEALRAE